MLREKLKEISEDGLNELIKNNMSLKELYFESLDVKKLEMVDGYFLNSSLSFCDSIFKRINMNEIIFNSNVEIKNCILGYCNFKDMVFNDSFTIEDCTVKKRLSFEYLAVEKRFVLKNVIFEEYVDFSPSSFEGSVIIENCKFLKGTNILSRLVSFHNEPTVTGCEGNLKIHEDFFDEDEEDIEIL